MINVHVMKAFAAAKNQTIFLPTKPIFILFLWLWLSFLSLLLFSALSLILLIWKKSLTTCVIAFYPFLFKIGKIKTEFMWQYHWLKSSMKKLAKVQSDLSCTCCLRRLSRQWKRWSDGYYSFSFETSFMYLLVKGETILCWICAN